MPVKELFMNKFLCLLVTLSASPSTFAHSGHADSFFGAAFHPLMGWDHLLAMFMVGIVAYHQMRRGAVTHSAGAQSGLIIPLSFMSSMTIGLIIAPSSPMSDLPFESVVLLSVFVMSWMVVKPELLRGLPVVLGCISIFGFAHGLAHGSELGGNAIMLTLGMLTGTGLLHGAGFLVGYRLAHRPWTLKGVGVLGVAASALLALRALA
jgi:urease accessory protein